ncbi:MAG: hypothetical protein U0353_05180 [Sandaracinus sp.]
MPRWSLLSLSVLVAACTASVVAPDAAETTQDAHAPPDARAEDAATRDASVARDASSEDAANDGGPACVASVPCTTEAECGPGGRCVPGCHAQLPPDAPCPFGIDACQPGYACTLVGREAHCRPLPGIGEACGTEGALCALGAWCSVRTCVARGGAGAACDRAIGPLGGSDQCEPDLYCALDDTCSARMPDGGACSAAVYTCMEGSYCDGASGTCLRCAAVGEPCSASRLCLPELRCDASTGRCADPEGTPCEGAFCTRHHYCGPMSACDCP